MTSNLSVNRKTTKNFILTFTTSGSVQNITGWTVFFTVKKKTSQLDTEASISKTITSHTTPLSGITTITLTDTDTDIPSGDYVYDITYIDTSNNRKSTGVGTFRVMDYVTQRSS
jgi:hypothetical protein